MIKTITQNNKTYISLKDLELYFKIDSSLLNNVSTKLINVSFGNYQRYVDLAEVHKLIVAQTAPYIKYRDRYDRVYFDLDCLYECGNFTQEQLADIPDKEIISLEDLGIHNKEKHTLAISLTAFCNL